MSQNLHLLLNAFNQENTCFFLGAGASAPYVPLTFEISGQIEKIFTEYVTEVPCNISKNNHYHRLIDFEKSKNWKLSGITEQTIALCIEYLYLPQRIKFPSQYFIFKLFPQKSSVYSFNWDGQAERYCPQDFVIHPHKTIRSKIFYDLLSDFNISCPNKEIFEILTYIEKELIENQMKDTICLTQESLIDVSEFSSSKLVLPGEEEGEKTKETRKSVFRTLLGCSSVIIIGYSFGISTFQSYDKIWQEIFCEAMKRNRVPIHIISPNADVLAGELSEKIGRNANIHSWPFYWNALSLAIINMANKSNNFSIVSALANPESLIYDYYRLREE